MITYLPLIGSVVVSILGGGLLGVWLTHSRLAPKSKAEARDITAAAQDKDWARFQREIGRLVKRLEDAETKADRAQREADLAISKVHECEEREARLKGRVIELESYVTGRGKADQEAAGILAKERLSDRASRVASK